MIFTCCSLRNKPTEENQTKYYYVNFDFYFGNEVMIDTIKIDYSICQKDSVYTLKYIYKKDSTFDTLTYTLKESTLYKPSLFQNNEDQEFQYVTNMCFKYKGKIFKVYKYAKNAMAIDGCVTHFWVPEFGIILKRSTTWRNYCKLRTSSDSTNIYIDFLSEMIFQNPEFYSGCDERVELMPESVTKDFFDWKYKELESHPSK